MILAINYMISAECFSPCRAESNLQMNWYFLFKTERGIISCDLMACHVGVKLPQFLLYWDVYAEITLFVQICTYAWEGGGVQLFTECQVLAFISLSCHPSIPHSLSLSQAFRGEVIAAASWAKEKHYLRFPNERLSPQL